MTISRAFCPDDRCYTHAFGLCSYEKGWTRTNPGFDPAMTAAFEDLELGDMLH